MLIAVLVIGIVRIVRESRGTIKRSGQEIGTVELWNSGDYDSIIMRCEESLKRDPMDTDALVFKGLSCFYKAVSEISLEDKIPFYDEAIVALRRARLSGNSDWVGEIDYILGKTYFHKGKYYYDLSVKYLEASLREGFKGGDSYEYLGIAYTELEHPGRGIEWFLKALAEQQTDLLLLTIAQSYIRLQEYDSAEEYLLQAVETTEEISIEKKSRFLLGEIYTGRQEYSEAEVQYSRILELDSESADAHFYLGEVYLAMGDRIKARAKWREALRYDPAHYAARLRYY